MKERTTPETTVSIFVKLYKIVEPKRRRQFWILFAGMILVAFFESLTMAAVAFFATSIANPNRLVTSKIYLVVTDWLSLGFDPSPALVIGWERLDRFFCH